MRRRLYVLEHHPTADQGAIDVQRKLVEAVTGGRVVPVVVAEP
jgi:hypothetical protein